MKKIIVCLLAVSFLCALRFVPIPNWKVNTEKINVNFVLPLGGNESGKFTGMDAKINFDPSSPQKSTITATIDAKTVSSSDAEKTGVMLSPEYLDAEKFPKIIFTSTKISAKAPGFILEGKLQVKKIIKKVSFPFTFEKTDEGGIFKGEFEIFGSDYGVMKKSKSGSDKIKISFTIPVLKE